MSSNNLINNTLLTNIPKPNKSLRSLDAGPTETLEVLLEPHYQEHAYNGLCILYHHLRPNTVCNGVG